MSDNFNFEGKILIENNLYELEYEPSCMVGLGTVFLRIKNAKRVIPIHISDIDDVIEMLQRGKKVIIAFEGRDTIS